MSAVRDNPSIQANPAGAKARLSFWQIWNMSFGFLGIQFGWGLQMANMSAIYGYLGANPDSLAILWLAAPITGVIISTLGRAIQRPRLDPIGRRRPFILAGAILASLALVLMPNSPSVWMAAGLLWVWTGPSMPACSRSALWWPTIFLRNKTPRVSPYNPFLLVWGEQWRRPCPG